MMNGKTIPLIEVPAVITPVPRKTAEEVVSRVSDRATLAPRREGLEG